MPLSKLEVIVAGGSGGIGREVTERLIAAGATVTISYRQYAERALEMANVAGVVQADLKLPDDRRRLLESCGELYGVVVLAGDPARVGPGEALEDAMRRSHEANYLGPILLAREAAERMRGAGTPGSIVLVATMQALGLFLHSTVYAAQKAALVHAARILAKETRGASGIRVNVVSPGIIDAGMAKASIAAGKYDRYLEDGTIARFGQPRDVARGIEFLLAPDSYITGQVLAIDGGITL